MIYYKTINENGVVGAKGITCDGATLCAGQIEITAEEYAALVLAPNAAPQPEEEPPLTATEQLVLTQLQQQETIDALVALQLGGEENV